MSWNGILVTGCPRSGTSWVGSVLSRARGLAYIHEPFNPDQGSAYSPIAFPHQYLRVTSRNEAVYRASVARTLTFYYNLPRALRKAYLDTWKFPGLLKEVGRILETAVRMKAHQLLGWWQPMVKDPIALLSADWLAREFRLRPVVLIRHPGGFVSRALRNPEFLTPPESYVFQDEFLSDLLAPYLGNGQSSPLHLAATQWLLLNRVVAHFEDTQPEWLFFHYEELALDPMTGFQRLFAQLGLELTPEIERVIDHYSSTSHPADPAFPWELKRDSRATCYHWRERLSDEQRQQVWSRTAELAGRWYQEDGVRISDSLAG